MSEPKRGMVAGQAIQTQAQTKEFDEGYERIFGTDRRPQRGRYVYSPEAGECVQVGSDWTDAPRRAQTPTEELTYGGLRATDGTPINTKSRHRNYMKANGLTLASDFTETWQKDAKAREQLFSNREQTEARKQAIADALRKGKRR